MTTISPAYAAKLRRLDALLGGGLLDECPRDRLHTCGGPFEAANCLTCGGTRTVVPPLEVLLGRLVRAAQAQFGAIWLYRHRDWLLMADPEDKLLDAILGMWEKV